MKFNVPKKTYAQGPKKMISWRLPEDLIGELEKVAEEKGYSVTDLVSHVLSQYLEQEAQKGSKKGKRGR